MTHQDSSSPGEVVFGPVKGIEGIPIFNQFLNARHLDPAIGSPKVTLSREMAAKKEKNLSTGKEPRLIDGHKLSVDSPEWAAAQTIGWILYSKEFYSSEKAAALLPILVGNATEVKQGDLSEAERILVSQAEVLQAFFNRTLGLAAMVIDNPEHCDRYASLALRAQDQCRKTLMALAELKNPKKPTQFIKNYVDKQLNQLKVEQGEVSTLDQAQVHSSSHEILEASPYAPMDTRSETTTAGIDSDLETVEVVNRAKHRCRKGDK